MISKQVSRGAAKFTMTAHFHPTLDSNPFATRFTRPGALPFLFPAEVDAPKLARQLAANHWWGEIVGPHGTGKSSLLAELAPLLEGAGRTLVRATLSRDRRQPPFTAADAALWTAATQVIVDGYEQLSWWNRRTLQAWVRGRKAGLLVTTHQPLGLPPLWRTAPTLELAQQLVARLLPSGDSTIGAEDVASAFANSTTNLREMLFALYDVYQSRQRRP